MALPGSWKNVVMVLPMALAAMLLSLRALPEKTEEDAVERELLHLESSDNLQLDPLQRRAVIQSVQNGVFLLTGGPGTG